MRPLPVRHSPAIARSSDVLPTPLSPTISKRSCGPSSKERSRTSVLRASGVWSVSASMAMRGLSTVSICAGAAAAAALPAAPDSLRPVARFQVAAQALHDRGEAAERVELIDDDRERRTQRQEGGARLGDLTELDLAGEVGRREDDDRHQREQQVVGVGEERDVALPPDHQDRVLHDRVQTPEQLDLFAPLAAVERDRLGVVAQPDQAVAEVRLATSLREVDADQRATDHDRQQRPQAHADHEHGDQAGARSARARRRRRRR